MTYYIRQTNVDWDGDGSAEPIEYEFNLMQRIQKQKQYSQTVVGAPEAENSVAYNFTPPKIRVPVEWLIHDDGTDKSRGTLSSSGISDSRFSGGTVETLQEQRVWLEDYIFDGASGIKYELYGGEFSDPDGDGTDEGTDVVVQTDVSIEQNADQIQVNPASVVFAVAEAV